MKTSTAEKHASEETPQGRVVYLHAGVALGVVLGRAEGGRWRVRLHGAERELPADPCVDPALLDDAVASGARVLIDGGAEPAIVGAVVTSRPVAYGRDGALDVRAPRVTVDAASEVTLKTPWSFVRLNQSDAEVFGQRVVLRAREVARFLARMISMN